MKTIALLSLVLLCAGVVNAAIPSAAECKEARAKLAELTADDYKALKAKKMSNEQVGDALAQYADNEESAAGKFALLQDAFQQYVTGKSVDKADGVYSKAQTIGGMEYAIELVRPAKLKLSGYATSKYPAAKLLKDRIAADEKSFQRVAIVKAQLKKSPGDEKLCEQLGVEYAACGDWQSALAAFVTAPGEIAKIADWELNGGKGVDYTAATVGAFWWKFADNFPKRKNVEETMKLHAAIWYKLALDKDAFRGNERTLIEKRIEKYYPKFAPNAEVKLTTKDEPSKESDTCVQITPTLIWENVDLDSIVSYSAHLVGNAMGGDAEKAVEGYNVKADGNTRTIQFQHDGGSLIRCVSVLLIQQDGNVWGLVRYARYKRGGHIGLDFDIEKCEDYGIAEYKDGGGYGVMGLSFVRGNVQCISVAKQPTKRTIVFDRYIALKPALIWKNVNLNDIDEIDGFMVGECPKKLAKGYNLKRSTSGISIQFQTYDGDWIKCVSAKFSQRGKNVFGNVCYSGYVSRRAEKLGTDFEKCTFQNKQTSEKEGNAGYGIKGVIAKLRK